MAKKNKSSLRSILIGLLLIILVGGGVVGYFAYQWIYAPNVELETEKPVYLYIHTGWKFDDVLKELKDKHYVKDLKSFEKIARRKKYVDKVQPGRYRLQKGMSNNSLINMLRAGEQDPVKLILSGVRKKEELVHKFCTKLEMDSADLLATLNDNQFLKKYKLDRENVLTLFIPNTYELKWNISIHQLLDRIAKEHDEFWTPERKKKAEAAELTPVEVSILASIVQSETTKDDDKPIIAGVYINRIHKDMPLEADPTLVWALNDFTIKRVLNEHKKIDSPYNTYKYAGLPPGPICLPTINTLDAVLNYEHHNYIYFCAKEDFSGYSNFATTLKEHQENAKRYTRELNKRKIYK